MFTNAYALSNRILMITYTADIISMVKHESVARSRTDLRRSTGSGPVSADTIHKTAAMSAAKIKRDKRACQIPGSFAEPLAAPNEQQSVFIRGGS